MAKVNLDQTYLYKGKHYGPGEVEFPEVTEAEKAGLSAGLKDAIGFGVSGKSPETKAKEATKDEKK